MVTINTKFSLSYITTTLGPGIQVFIFIFIFFSNVNPLPQPPSSIPHEQNYRYDEWFKNMHNFDDYLVARNELVHVKEPDSPTNNPYTWTHKRDWTPVRAIMSLDLEKIATFQTVMSDLDMAILVVGYFDFSALKTSEGKMQLVEVGGCHGTVLKQILSAHPDFDPKQCVLQDRPEFIKMMKAGGVLPDVQFMAHNFMTEQPVKGAKAYFMRMNFA